MGYLEGHYVKRDRLFVRFIRDFDFTGWEDERVVSGILDDTGPGVPLQIEILAGPSRWLVAIDGEEPNKSVEPGVSEVPASHCSDLLEEIAELEQQFEEAEFQFPEGGRRHIIQVLQEESSRRVREWFLRHKSFELQQVR